MKIILLPGDELSVGFACGHGPHDEMDGEIIVRHQDIRSGRSVIYLTSDLSDDDGRGGDDKDLYRVNYGPTESTKITKAP